MTSQQGRVEIGASANCAFVKLRNYCYESLTLPKLQRVQLDPRGK